MTPTDPQDVIPVPPAHRVVAADQIAIGEAVAETPIPASDHGPILHQIVAELAALRLMLAKELDQPEEDQFLVLNSAEISLRRRGRRFLLIFTPVQIDNVVFNVQGLSFTALLTRGWNNISLPDGTTVIAPTGTSQPIMIRITNWTYGGAI